MNLQHHKQSQLFTLRGGGCGLCKSQIEPAIISNRQQFIDEMMIQYFIKDLGQYTQEILNESQQIGLKESQEKIIKNIKWFNHSSQFIYEIAQSNQKISENMKLIQDKIEILLEAIINIIQSHRFIAFQILKSCSQLTRIVFIHYINLPKPPMKQEKQLQLLQQIQSIMEYITEGGENKIYYNSLYYEASIIKYCIDSCPTDSKEYQEILIKTFKGILNSISQMSPSSDMLSAIAQGANYLIKDSQKKKQREIFKIILYVEELKWQVIERIQNGNSINLVLNLLNNNYSKIISRTNSWQIKCCWIKMISQLMIYKPLITKSKLAQIQNQFNLKSSWQSLLNLKAIIPLDYRQSIGVLNECKINNDTIRILQRQLKEFKLLQNTFIRGVQNFPKFIDLIENKFQEPNEMQNEKLINYDIVSQLENIPLRQFQNQIHQFMYIIIDYIDQYNNFNILIESKDEIQLQQIVDCVDVLILQIEALQTKYKKLLKLSHIMDIQLLNISKIIEPIDYQYVLDNDYILIKYLISYMDVTRQINFKSKDLKSDLINIINQMQIQAKQNKIFSEVKQLIMKLQNNEEEFINSLKQIELNLERHQRSSKIKFINLVNLLNSQTQIKFHLNFMNMLNQDHTQLANIKYLLNQIKFVQFEQKVMISQYLSKQQSFQILFQNYCNVHLLGQIYDQLYSLQKDLVYNQEDLMNQISPYQSQYAILFGQILSQTQSQLSLELNIISDVIHYQRIQLVEQLRSTSVTIIISYIINCEIVFDLAVKQHKLINTINQLLITVSQIFWQPLRNLLNQLTQNLNEISNKQSSIYLNELLYFRSVQLQQLIEQIKDIFFDDKESVINDILNLINLIDYDVAEIPHQQLSIIIDAITNNHNRIIKSLENYNLMTQSLRFLIAQKDDLKIKKQKVIINQIIDQINKFILTLKITDYQQNQQEIGHELNKQINDIINSITDIFVIDLNLYKGLDVENQIFKDVDLGFINQENLQQLVPEYFELMNSNYRRDKTSLIQNVSIIQQIKDIYYNEQWRVKECFYLNCSKHTFLFGCRQQKSYWETDTRVVATLKHQDQIEQIESLINNQYKDSEEQIQNELQDTQNQLQPIKLQLQNEERKDIRDHLLNKYREISQLVEQQRSYVKEITGIIDKQIFIQDIQREQPPQELFEIRMNSVLQENVLDQFENINIQLQGREFDFYTNKEDDAAYLFNFDGHEKGLIDSYLKQDKKSSLIIHGVSGSGITNTLKKIEVYLWQQYKQIYDNLLWQNTGSDIPLIPIFIKLSNIKQPKYNLIDETLKTYYQFQQKQIDQLQTFVQQGRVKLLFLLDGYDEMAQQFQGKNLIQTNKLNIWKQENSNDNIKVICTFKSKSLGQEYRHLFWESDKRKNISIKEIRILQLDNIQRYDYIDKYSKLKLRILIKELLIIVCRKSQLKIINESDQIWQQIIRISEQTLITNQSCNLLKEQHLKDIIDILRKNEHIDSLSEDQEISFKKTLAKLWSPHQYRKIIKKMGLIQLISTPQMIKLVLSSLPSVYSQICQSYSIKQDFLNNYQQFKFNHYDSTIKMYQYGNDIIRNKYNQQQIAQLRTQQNKQTLENEAQKIWDSFNKHNFFAQWSRETKFDEMMNQLRKIKKFASFDDESLIIIVKCLKTQKITVYQFFKAYFLQYIQNQIKLMIFENTSEANTPQFQFDITEYGIRLAVIMSFRQQQVCEIKQYGKLFRSDFPDPYQSLFNDDSTNYKQLIRKCLPLSQQGNFISFNHKSIQDYLFVQDIINLFERIQQNFDQINNYIQLQRQNNNQEVDSERLSYILNQVKQSPINKIMVQGNFFKNSLRFLINYFEENHEIRPTLDLAILFSSISTDYIKFSSNAFNILLKLEQTLINKNFTRIRIEDINIDGINFCNCDFSDSVFKNVKVQGISLNYSNLTNIQWSIQSTDLPLLVGHTDEVTCAIFYNGGEKILTGGRDSTIRQWMAKSGKLIGPPIRGHQDAIVKIVLDEPKFISISVDGNIKVWDPNPVLQIVKDIQIGAFKCIEVSDNKKFVAIGAETPSLQIFDIYSNQSIHKIYLGLECLDLSINARLLAIFSDNTIRVWDIISGLQVGESIKSAEIQKIQYSSDGNYAISIHSQVIRKWDAHTWQNIQSYFIEKQLLYNTLQISNSNQEIIYANADNTITILDLNTGIEFISTKKGHFKPISSLKYAPDGKNILSTSADRTARIWDVKTIMDQQIQDQGAIQAVAFSPDGNQFCYAGQSRKIFVCDSQTGQQLFEPILLTNTITKLVYHPIGKYIASSSFDKSVIIWDARSGRQIGEPIIHSNLVYTLCYSPDGKIIVTADYSGIIRVFEASSKDIIKKISGHQGIVKCLAVTQDYRYIVSAGQDRLIRIWNIQTGQLNQQLQGHDRMIHSFSLHRDGKLIISAGEDGKIILWDLILGTLIRVIKETQSCLFSIQFSPNGKYFAVSDRTIRFFDINSGDQIGESLKEHQEYIYSIQFSPSGNQLISGSENNTLKLWEKNQSIHESLKSLNESRTNVALFFERLTIQQSIVHKFVLQDAIINNSSIISNGYDMIEIWKTKQ
ncbi:hypothetical protein pb186bvf_020054 [Paramecium bursaria]